MNCFETGLYCVAWGVVVCSFVEHLNNDHWNTHIITTPISANCTTKYNGTAKAWDKMILWGLFNLFVTHFLIVYEGTRSKMSCETCMLGCKNVCKEADVASGLVGNILASSER